MDWDLCDGVTINFTDDNGVTQTKMFNIMEANATMPDGCYDETFDDDDGRTPLGFIIGEYDAGTSLAVVLSHYSPFEDWKRAEDIASYAVWSCEDEMVQHLKHLQNNGEPSATPPIHPLTVTLVA